MERSPGRLADLGRQLAVLITALAQPVVTIVVFSGRGYGEVFGGSSAEPPMVPASYAFMIWTAIFAGALGLAIYQALPSQRADGLMRSIGWPVASGFLATNLWLVAAAGQRAWLTVICILWIFASLYSAYRSASRRRPSPAQRQFVVIPISVFLGWVSVATFANVASAASAAPAPIGWLAGVPGAVALLAAATAVVLAVLRRDGRNRWYAGAAIWALVGVLVANVDSGYGQLRLPVALAAGVAIITVLVFAVRTGSGLPEKETP